MPDNHFRDGSLAGEDGEYSPVEPTYAATVETVGELADQNMHLGYQRETLVRFLMARDGNVLIAHKMLTDCLNWRIQNEIDCTLRKPIVPSDMYRAIRNSQLVRMPGYTKEVPLEGPHLIQYLGSSVDLFVCWFSFVHCSA